MSGRKLSPAMWRYIRRLSFFMLLYVVVLLPVAFLYRSAHWPAPPWSYLVALAPALPIFGAIWTIFAYVDEEPDEYWRHLHIRTQMLAFGFTLGACSAWNFLSNYSDLLPDRVWVFPIYCACLGAAMGWTRWRAR